MFNPNKGEIPRSQPTSPKVEHREHRSHHRSGTNESKGSGYESTHGSSKGSESQKRHESSKHGRSRHDKDRYSDTTAIRLAKAMRNILVN